jgi:hypothetical protein
MTRDPEMTAKKRRDACMTAQLESLLCGLKYVAASQRLLQETVDHIVADLRYEERLRACNEEIRQTKAAFEEASTRRQALQRQGVPEASSEPERSRAIAGPSVSVSSSGSIM